MLINRGNLQTLGVGFNAAFKDGLAQAANQHELIATRMASATSSSEFGWLGMVPGVREWIGDRVIQNLRTHDYTIKNRDYELTLAVDANHIKDDNLGIYGPLFTEMGRATAAFWNQLAFGLLRLGFSEICYDKQYFFDTDHPVIDANGVVQSVANTDGGGGAPWFLIDDSRAIKPIILQVREDFAFVAKDSPEDDNVFWKREYVYGTQARGNAGFGFWQFAWGSKQPLTGAAYGAARATMQGFKGDHGRPIGVMPKLLIVPPSLEAAALEIVNAERNAAGATNIYKGTARVEVVPWLA